MLPNMNGDLAPAFKTHELRKRRADGTTESQKTTLVPDGAGKWQLSGMRQITDSQEGENRSAEEHVFRRNPEGKLSEVTRVVSHEPSGTSGENRTMVENYSIDVPGSSRDGHLHLVERVRTFRQTNASGGQTTPERAIRHRLSGYGEVGSDPHHSGSTTALRMAGMRLHSSLCSATPAVCWPGAKRRGAARIWSVPVACHTKPAFDFPI